MSTLKERKAINNYIPKFDLGANLVKSSGRLTTVSVDPSKFSATSAYTGYNTAAKSISTPSTLSKIGGHASNLVSGISPILLNVTSFSSAASTNVTNAINSGLVNSAGQFTQKGAEAAVLAGFTSAGSGLDAGAAGTEAALKGAGLSVANSGLSLAGSALGVASGLYTMFSGMNDYQTAKDGFLLRITDKDMLNSASTSTQTKFGRSYKQIGGFDENGILNLTNALNTAGGDAMRTAASSEGMGIGTAAAAAGMGIATAAGASLGSVVPVVGTIIGAGLGALTGWLFGDSSADEEEAERLRKVKLDIANAKEAIGGYNTESEAEAGSLGLRDMYNATHSQSRTGIINADKGKPVTFNPSYAYGKNVQGKASPDETYRNTAAPLMDRVGYFGSKDQNVKDQRVDNVNLYGDIDPVQIAGHNPKAKINNKYIADLARPLGKEAELIRDEYNKTNDSYRKLQLEDRMKSIDLRVGALMDILEDMTNRDNMKHQLNYRRINANKTTPKYGFGKWLTNAGNSVANFVKDNSEYVPAILGSIASLSNSNDYLNWINSQQPLMLPSSYVEAADGSYLKALASLHDDPSAELAALNNTARQNRYNVLQSGALSAGQRMALTNAANNQLFSKRSAILEDYARRNAAYKQAWAQAGIQSAQYAAARQQQAIAAQNEQYAKAVSAYNNLQANQYANKQTLYNSIAQALSTAKNTKGMMNLWNKLIDSLNPSKGNSLNPSKGGSTAQTETPAVAYVPVLTYLPNVQSTQFGYTGPTVATEYPSYTHPNYHC